MFTGLVEETGTVVEIGTSRGAKRLRISATAVPNDLKIDDSVSVSGVCLTVIEHGDGKFAVEAVQETLKKTTIGQLRRGDKVNLERALRADSRLGGHFVQGHVDGVARVREFMPQAGGKLLSLALPDALLPYVIPRGSIAVDGVSLTIAELQGNMVHIALIPHTLQETTLGLLKPGDIVNIETDMLGKYVLRTMQAYLPEKVSKYDHLDLRTED